MRSGSERRTVGAAALALTLVCLGPAAAAAEQLTFHLPVRDAVVSVERFNTFLVSKRARGLKLIAGGTLFAGQSCAGFGSVYKVGSIAVLSGPGAFGARVPTRNGRTATTLAATFTAAGADSWLPPAADAETSVPFWGAVPFASGVQFAAEGVTNGGDSGLLGTDPGDGVLRFRANVVGAPDAEGRYRFIVELYGRTSSNDTLVAAGERRCFTFVDLVPVDLSALRKAVDGIVKNPNLRGVLEARLDSIEIALERRDIATALHVLGTFNQAIILRADRNGSSGLPPAISLADARRLTAAAFHFRRGIVFTPSTAECGNGIRETGEACDGADLGGLVDCASPPLNFGGGPLTCGTDCLLDTSQCIVASVCGNGVLEAGEECDKGPGNSNTLPDACRTNCKRADCGDGVIDSFEDCEGRNLNGETCVGLGYDGGTLRCDAEECEFDDERCSEG